jgi:hypothetical protein
MIMRSVLGVLAASLLFTVALFAGEAAANANGFAINQSTSARLIWLAWLAMSMTGAGFVAAWIAPRSGARNAVILGVIQAAMTAGAMLTTDGGGEPWWSWIAGIALMVPAAWCGARIRSIHHVTTSRSSAGARSWPAIRRS